MEYFRRCGTVGRSSGSGEERFELVKVSGSHHKFRKNGETVTVPHPKKDLPIGTVRAIYKQAG